MLLLAHRGASAYEPENTLRAFKAAMKTKASGVEFDVRATKDKKLVVFHSKELESTTDGEGLLKEFTYRQVRKLDVGKGEMMPSLREAVRLMRGKAVMAVEIKERGTEKGIVDVVKRVKDVIVISFSPESVKAAKRYSSKMQTGLLFANKIKNTTGFFRLGKVIKADWLFGNYKVVTKKFITDAHKWKFKVMVWNIDDTKTQKKFIKMGVDGISSNNPKLFSKLH